MLWRMLRRLFIIYFSKIFGSVSYIIGTDHLMLYVMSK